MIEDVTEVSLQPSESSGTFTVNPDVACPGLLSSVGGAPRGDGPGSASPDEGGLVGSQVAGLSGRKAGPGRGLGSPQLSGGP